MTDFFKNLKWIALIVIAISLLFIILIARPDFLKIGDWFELQSSSDKVDENAQINDNEETPQLPETIVIKFANSRVPGLVTLENLTNFKIPIAGYTISRNENVYQIPNSFMINQRSRIGVYFLNPEFLEKDRIEPYFQDDPISIKELVDFTRRINDYLVSLTNSPMDEGDLRRIRERSGAKTNIKEIRIEFWRDIFFKILNDRGFLVCEDWKIKTGDKIILRNAQGKLLSTKSAIYE